MLENKVIDELKEELETLKRLNSQYPKANSSYLQGWYDGEASATTDILNCLNRLIKKYRGE